jgi:hypothetical protein
MVLLVDLLAPYCVSTVIPVPNPVPRAHSFSIAMWSYKRGTSGLIWDIGQVSSRSFDWLPFTPSGRLLRSFTGFFGYRDGNGVVAHEGLSLKDHSKVSHGVHNP